MDALLDFWLAKLVALAPLVVGYCHEPWVHDDN